ncbi:hypothetical protein SAMN05660297_01915 [Natronincola peptidivorans]|uniref:Uncharacterized protein n=1 Tax=Natronincola peptidivorans TaxID=426128 RepID=A0A1I0D992_9FIRM|nr:hypothetical protein [Natronincola peptidivorans]SET28521.1 hypothetical protein SAMN05660297_01915 [Natronincola peptidivorans]
MIKENTKDKEIQQILEALPKETVIGEFSGRDSVAAILKALEDNGINDILPVASFAATEYGDPTSLEENYLQMVERVKTLYGDNKKIHPLIYYSNPDLWSIINGRFVEVINRKFGFYTPCIGCHAYFHLLRVPMALKLGRKIISGERENHDGRVKVNQLGSCLDIYQEVTRHFGVELLMPLRHVDKGEEVERLIGWNWQEGDNHPDCIYSGNYRDIEGTALYDEEKVRAFLESYLLPLCIQLGELIVNKEDSSKVDMVKIIMEIEEIA